MNDCLFCKIIGKSIPAKIAFEDDSLVAIHDINPQAPTHLLIIPKRHIDRISHCEGSDSEIFGNLILVAKRLAQQNGIEDGFRLVFNNGTKAGQSVFHVHLHLLGGRKMSWPPG